MAKTKQVKFNPILHFFFRELWMWIEAGAPDGHKIFHKTCGLCGSLDNWLNLHLDMVQDGHHMDKAMATLRDLFDRDYGESGFPFNAQSSDFYNESSDRAMYRNIHRNAFVYHYSFRENWLSYEERDV